MGPVFDATLDGEDGAPVEARRGACGADGELVMGTGNRFGRVGVRLIRTAACARRRPARGGGHRGAPPPCHGGVRPMVSHYFYCIDPESVTTAAC
jgi:hypothetical protein